MKNKMYTQREVEEQIEKYHKYLMEQDLAMAGINIHTVVSQFQEGLDSIMDGLDANVDSNLL
jgi:hypothetical protein